MEYIELGYFGLFIICFLAATVLPLASEGVLLLFLAANFDPVTCLIVATLGNSIGGLSNYFIGLLGKPDKLKRLFKKPRHYARMINSVDKYGYWLALLSWLPIIGDPLVVALGFFRVKFIPMLILMVLSRFLRYYLIIFIWNS